MTGDLEARETELREMVENHWRNLIRFAGVNPQMAAEEVFRFEAMIDQLALGYPPAQAQSFRGTLQALRGKYADWERTDPAGLRKALNVTGGGGGTATAWLAALETPSNLDLRGQLDDFWREAFATSVFNARSIETRWAAFVSRMQAQVAHLPQPEQEGVMMRVVLRNAEYIALAKSDRERLKTQLGVQSGPSLGPVATAVGETVVQATIWQGIGALFRAFR